MNGLWVPSWRWWGSDCSVSCRDEEMQASSRSGNKDSPCSPPGFINSIHDVPSTTSLAVAWLCPFSGFWSIDSLMGYTSESFHWLASPRFILWIPLQFSCSWPWLSQCPTYLRAHSCHLWCFPLLRNSEQFPMACHTNSSLFPGSWNPVGRGPQTWLQGCPLSLCLLQVSLVSQRCQNI